MLIIRNILVLKTDSAPSGSLVYSASALHIATVLSQKNLSIDYVKTLPIEEIATYADPIAIANVDQKWIQPQFLPIEERLETTGETFDSWISRINATTFGNIAFAALFAKDEKVRASSATELQQMLNWAKK